ncbi:MAG: glycosyltransferase family 2 protein [Solirubrobacterales bacterium]|nr:glycosyltransferase family 2 protein [Solirubrobacterales bacterium]
MVDRVAFCVTTFMRPAALGRLLASIAEHVPAARVHVADQGGGLDDAGYDRLWRDLRARGLLYRPVVERLPFDCGVSAARNRLVDLAPGEFKLILDDDFVFTADTRVERFVALLDHRPDAGVVGGRVTRDGDENRFDLRFERAGGLLREVPEDGPFLSHDGIRYREADCVVNFALMRAEVFERVRWDPRLKIAEHEDFFLRLLDTPFRVLHTPDVTVDHPPPDLDGDYPSFRNRPEFVVTSMVKHGLHRVETVNGLVAELDAERLVLRLPGGGALVHSRRGSAGST